jgi:hypothetical protein
MKLIYSAVGVGSNCDCDFVSSRHQALSRNRCYVTEWLISELGRVHCGHCDFDRPYPQRIKQHGLKQENRFKSQDRQMA